MWSSRQCTCVCDTHVDIMPTSIILIISIHNPSWVQESVVETITKTVFCRCLTNNLGLIHGVGVVEACRGPVPVIILEHLAGRTKSARGPDPARGPCLARGWFSGFSCSQKFK